MVVAIRDMLLQYLPAEPYGSLEKLEVDHLDLTVAPGLTTPFFTGREGGRYRLGRPHDRTALRNRLAETHARVHCLSLAAPPGQEGVGRLEDVLQAARELGATVVRVTLIPQDEEREESPQRWLAPVDELVQATRGRLQDLRLAFGLPGWTHHPSEPADALLECVPQEVGGLVLDPADIYSSTGSVDAVYDWTRRYGGRLVHVDADNLAPSEGGALRPCPLPDGSVDYKRVAALLSEAGYRGVLAVADRSLQHVHRDHALTVLRGDVEYLQSVLR